MTMATILSTASFRLWQKLTRALPFGPILPSMMPADTEKVAVTQVAADGKSYDYFLAAPEVISMLFSIPR